MGDIRGLDQCCESTGAPRGRIFHFSLSILYCLLPLLALAGGCASSHSVSTQRLLEHQAQLDFTGLKVAQDSQLIHVTSSPPQHWRSLPIQETAVYVHQQWKSPSGATGAGVVYIHLPLPMSAKMLLWLARMEYSKDVKDGKVQKEWTDELNRPWFEGENGKYHIRGYAIVDGFSAWIVYSGYKVARPVNPEELSIANKYVESVVPTNGEKRPSNANLADAGKPRAEQKPG